MKLYYSKGSCSLAIRILIHELGLPCEYVSVNHTTKETEHGENYLTINSKGAVPALLTDENEMLTENAVIQQYLADTHKATALLPALGDFKRYRTLEWLNYVSTDLHKSFGPLFNTEVPQDIKNTIFIPALKKKFAYVDQHLSQQDYLLGDHFTLPDGYLFVVLCWLSRVNLDITEWRDLSRYFIQLQSRKTIQQSLEEEKIALKSTS